MPPCSPQEKRPGASDSDSAQKSLESDQATRYRFCRSGERESHKAMAIDPVEINTGCHRDPLLIEQPGAENSGIVCQMADVCIDIKRAVGRRQTIDPESTQPIEQQ